MVLSVIKGTKGLREMRFSLENEGKRGGVRVCYANFVVEETIYLITVYAKKDKDNLSCAADCCGAVGVYAQPYPRAPDE